MAFCLEGYLGSHDMSTMTRGKGGEVRSRHARTARLEGTRFRDGEGTCICGACGGHGVRFRLLYSESTLLHTKYLSGTLCLANTIMVLLKQLDKDLRLAVSVA